MRPFVGRTTEIEEIAALLDNNRLVTLTGPSGSGKSRLASELGTRRAVQFGEGTFVVDIAPLSEAALIAPSIAALLRRGVPVDGTDADSLAEAIGDRELLLVADNCDRFADAIAKTLSTFLHRCKNLRVLATCRESLDVRGECSYPLRPLAPDDARALFAQRAGSAGNRVDPRALDGIPLAIEIFATRATDAELDEIEQRPVSPDAAAQRAIEWAYQRLGHEERRVFRALSVFVGGFTLEAAAHLGTEPGSSIETTTAIVMRLERLALVARDGERFALLEPIRLYAIARLRDASEHERLARRHAEVFDHLAVRAWERAYDVTREELRTPIERELANIRAALVWSLDKRNDPRLGARIVGCIGVLWRDFGIPVEGLRRAQQAALQGEGDGRLWLTISTIKSALWMLPREQLDAAERAATLFDASGDSRGRIEALVREGRAYAFLRDYERAKRALGRAKHLALEFGNRRLAAQVAYETAIAAVQCDDYELAKALYEEVVPQFLANGERRLSAVALINLAEVEFATGNPLRAMECMIEVQRFGSDVMEQGVLKGNMTAYLIALDRRDEALATGREALRLMRLSEDRVRTVFLVQHLAAAYAQGGDLTRAARLLGYSVAQCAAFDVELEYTERYTRDLVTSAVEKGMDRAELDALVHEGSLFSLERAAEEALGSA